MLGRHENARGTWDDTVAHFVDAMMTRENGKQWNGEGKLRFGEVAIKSGEIGPSRAGYEGESLWSGGWS